MQIEVVPSPIAEEVASQPRSRLPVFVKRAFLCIVLAVVAVLVHGYHPFAVDGAIYVPAVKKQLNPELYPHGAQFFLFPAQLSIFAKLIVWSVRGLFLPLRYVLLLWYTGAIAVFLAACWRLCRLCFEEKRAALYGALLMGTLLTIPVSGTSLILSDPYLTSRSLSTPALLMAICCVLENKLARAGLWLLAAGLVHPLMAAFGGAFVVTLYAVQRRNWRLLSVTGAGFTAIVIAGILWARGAAISPDYRAAVLTRSYFFLSRWAWYEIVGLVTPLALFGLLLWYRRNDTDSKMTACLTAAILYGTFFLLVGLIIAWSPNLLVIAKYQPLRAFHLLYVLLFLLPVNAFVMKVTAPKPILATALLIATSGLMFAVQRATFPASAHVEWPWSRKGNDWVQAFEWVRGNTPQNAAFALDGEYMNAPGEDSQGFGAWAERSSLVDVSKYGGVAALFPNLAADWMQETKATANIRHLRGEQDVQALENAGASWVLLRREDATYLDCPYVNASVSVCRLGTQADASHRTAMVSPGQVILHEAKNSDHYRSRPGGTHRRLRTRHPH